MMHSTRTREAETAIPHIGIPVPSATQATCVPTSFARFSIEIDGLAATHDAQHHEHGSFEERMDALEELCADSTAITVGTRINRLSARDLPLLYERILEAGASRWTWTLTAATAANDHPDVLLQPTEVSSLYGILAVIASRAELDGIRIEADEIVCCHQRALEMAQRGRRERIVRNSPERGAVRLTVVEESLDAPWPFDPFRFSVDDVVWPELFNRQCSHAPTLRRGAA